MIKTLPPRDEAKALQQGAIVINVTSHSTDFGRSLSPFFLGPVTLPNGQTSKNVENAWQFSKVFPEHVKNNKVTPAYWDWAKKGWADTYAHRRPMGRGKLPLFALGKDENDRLGYIAGRKKLYFPLYQQAVTKVPAFEKLQALAAETQQKGQTLVLIDFDAYDHTIEKMSFEEVINYPKKLMGHGFVLAMLLSMDPTRIQQMLNSPSPSVQPPTPTSPQIGNLG
jgi:hypothetical protein